MVVRWIKGSSIISNNHRVSSKNLPNGENDLHHYAVVGSLSSGMFDLTIANLSSKDSDEFYCMVCLSRGHVVTSSRKASLSVFRYSCETENAPREFYEAGDSITTTCAVRGKKSPKALYSLYWLTNFGEFNGSRLYPKTRRFDIRDSWTLSAVDDKTVVSCVINSHIATLNKKKCTLGPFRVYHPPIVSIFPISVQTHVNGSFRLDCSALANPPVTEYQWLLNKRPIAQSDVCYHITNGGRTITVKNLHEGNNGMRITCSVRNLVKISTLTRTVKVEAGTNDNSGTGTSRASSTQTLKRTGTIESTLDAATSPANIPKSDLSTDRHDISIIYMTMPSVAIVLLSLTVVGIVLHRYRRQRKWTPELYLDTMKTCRLHRFNTVQNTLRAENYYETPSDDEEKHFNNLNASEDNNMTTARSSPVTVKDSCTSSVSDESSTSVAKDEPGQGVRHDTLTAADRLPAEDGDDSRKLSNHNVKQAIPKYEDDVVSLTSFDLSLRVPPSEVKKDTIEVMSDNCGVVGSGEGVGGGGIDRSAGSGDCLSEGDTGGGVGQGDVGNGDSVISSGGVDQNISSDDDRRGCGNKERNVEGLVYADLEFIDSGNTPIRRKDSPVEYAELKK